MSASVAQIPLPVGPTPTPGAATKMAQKDFAVGTSIPANMPHAVSVSLPLWSDNVDYEEGRLTECMQTGYPRFFIHRTIQKLAALLCKKFGKPDEACILFPTAKIADRCRDFMRKQSGSQSSLSVRIVRFSMLESKSASDIASSSSSSPPPEVEPSQTANGTTAHYIFIVLFPANAFSLAKGFWQHTGDGISSRQAERCLHLLEDCGSLEEDESVKPAEASSQTASTSSANDDLYKKGGKRFYNRYARNNSTGSASLGPISSSGTPSSTPSSSTILTRPGESNGAAATAVDSMTSDHITYVEERYGRNLPLTSAPSAKLALRRRIAGTLLTDRSEDSAGEAPGDQVGETERKGTGLTEHDVFLYPCGMSAIFHAHQLAMRYRAGAAVGKSVCFGFPYTDTLKILQKFGPGCHFYGLGVDSDLDLLEQQLDAQSASNEPPILALFCELPSNPLLRSPNLRRIRQLADKHNFLVVIDETIGNFVNVEVLPFADILVSSLTKVFSGDANVMGGSMVLNPKGLHYAALASTLAEHYEDTYFDEDAIFMERNSRDFIRRILRIDENTAQITSLLWNEKLGQGEYSGVIKQVYYPKYQTRDNYEMCRRKQGFSRDVQVGGYGGLFSITFHSDAASEAFYDSLQCAKGPSLGTNLTLACPYTILAHYGELDWAAEFGVEKGLVRVSVGLEDIDFLKTMFTNSLRAAAAAHARTL